MKLYYAMPSPFVRKVMMAMKELKIYDQVELIETSVVPGKENSEYADRVNPLRKIPALELSDGSVVVDSVVICEYLNELDGSNRLIPADINDRQSVRTGHSIANGVMDAAVLIRYETFLRPEPNRWQVWIDEQHTKVDNALAWFDQRALGKLNTIEDIAVACALGYVDFRMGDYPWRDKYKSLAQWQASIADMPSFKETMPS